MDNRTKNIERTKKLVILSLFTAISFATVCVLHLKLSFLTFDLKDCIITIAALIYGPIVSIPVSSAVALIEFFTISESGVYGLIMNIIASVAFSFIVALVYKMNKNMIGGIIAVICGVVSMTSVMLLANLIITPYYMGATIDQVIQLIPKLLLPFNLIKAIVNGALVLILYKPIVNMLRKIRVIEKSDKEYAFDIRSIIMMVSALVIIIISILIFVFVLKGDIKFFEIFGG